MESLLTVNDVADKTRLSVHTIRKFVREDRLRPVRICRRLIFSIQELSRFLEEEGRALPPDARRKV
jgi:DNA-binding transcriptional MerR regulator